MAAVANGQSSIFSLFEDRTQDEDFVEYYLFPDSTQGASKCQEDLLILLNAAATSIIGDYLWHKDTFQLKLHREGYFHGYIRYDTCIEDEWFVVHVLQQLTAQFPGMVARAIDEDGEFLLIEAAEYLPEWADSDDTCEHRVYIYNGTVHLVGEVIGEDGQVLEPVVDEPLEISRAIQYIRTCPQKTIASVMIQHTIQLRVGTYPQKLLSLFHHVTATLPPKVAFLLKSRPSIIAHMTRAFHEMDPIEMKAVRLMPTFGPVEGLVKTRLRFTKLLFARLWADDYFPDKKIQWEFPVVGTPGFKGHCIGAKLTLGLEILLNRAKKLQGQTPDLECSPAWTRYQGLLKKSGYYRDLLQGSKGWETIEARAKSYFLSSVQSELEVEFSSEDHAVLEAESLLKNYLPGDYVPDESFVPDEDESWLHMGVADFESYLAAKFQTGIPDSDQNLDEIPDKLKEFMAKVSDYRGVEVDDDDEEGESSDLDPMDFRPHDFPSAMDKLLSELGKPSTEFDLSEPSSEEDEGHESVKMNELEKKYADLKVLEVMAAMDKELEGTEVGKSFETAPTADGQPRKTVKVKRRCNSKGDDGVTDTGSSPASAYPPVDVDLNALTNILASYQAQDGDAGPSANLLRNVGFDISKAVPK